MRIQTAINRQIRRVKRSIRYGKCDLLGGSADLKLLGFAIDKSLAEFRCYTLKLNHFNKRVNFSAIDNQYKTLQCAEYLNKGYRDFKTSKHK